MVVSDPEILSFSSKVWFIELAEVFGVKIMCIFLCLKSCIFKKHHTFFAVYCVIFKNNGGLILIYKNQQIFPMNKFTCHKMPYLQF